MFKMTLSLHRARGSGFSLVEVLIAVGLLGLIGAFTIPKLLDGGTKNTQWKRMAQAMAVQLSAAYSNYKMDNTVTAGFHAALLGPYFDNVKRKTSGLVDDRPGQGSLDCTWAECYDMHNGGTLILFNDNTFGGTSSEFLVYVRFDPDSVYSGSSSGIGKSVTYFLYYDGKIRPETDARVGDRTFWYGAEAGWSPHTAPVNPSYVPSWFNWN
ncbi:MAG: hypothetical protein SFZ03_12300 [Candidatus Melainabacteria bacterium]|nr:hypothetical protein [Candidatus Melainabacteria bacterium]